METLLFNRVVSIFLKLIFSPLICNYPFVADYGAWETSKKCYHEDIWIYIFSRHFKLEIDLHGILQQQFYQRLYQRVHQRSIPLVSTRCDRVCETVWIQQSNYARITYIFAFLKQLPYLKKLHIKDIKVIPELWLSNSIKYSKNILRICFEYTHIKSSTEGKDSEIFKEVIRNASYMKYWKFINIDFGLEFFEMSWVAIQLELEDTNLKCIDFKNASITSFCLRRTFYHNPSFNFIYLQTLVPSTCI